MIFEEIKASVFIPIRGGVVRVDWQDRELIHANKYRVKTWKNKKGTYVVRSNYYLKNDKKVCNSTWFLHFDIKGKPLQGIVTDHIDGNTLNNTRNNLRHISPHQNSINKKTMKHGLPLYISKVRNKKNGVISEYFVFGYSLNKKLIQRWRKSLAEIIEVRNNYLKSIGVDIEELEKYKRRT